MLTENIIESVESWVYSDGGMFWTILKLGNKWFTEPNSRNFDVKEQTVEEITTWTTKEKIVITAY